MTRTRPKSASLIKQSKSTPILRSLNTSEKEKYKYVHERLEKVAKTHKNFATHIKWLVI